MPGGPGGISALIRLVRITLSSTYATAARNNAVKGSVSEGDIARDRVNGTIAFGRHRTQHFIPSVEPVCSSDRFRTAPCYYPYSLLTLNIGYK